MSGHLIGPKTCNQNVKILGPCGQSVIVCVDRLGALDHNLFNKLCSGVHEVGNDHRFRVHKVEPMLGEWAVLGQPTVLLWDY